MTLSLLDCATLGSVDLSIFDRFGIMRSYESTSLDERIAHIGISEIVLTNKVVIDEDVMARCPNLKLICVTATGTNNVDLEYAKDHHIVVKNVAGYSTTSVAQATFAMALSIIGNSAYYDAYVKSKVWSKSEIFTNFNREFFELKGKVWGIIGLGNIGKEVAKIASVFGANVQYYSTSGKNHDSEYNSVNLDRLLASSDVISIHAPLNTQTENLIQKAELLKMKEGAIILNMGRGGIINEQDLAEVIDSRDIFAGLDVAKTEPIEEGNPLLHIRKKEHIRFTPHTAWASKEARATLIKLVAKNIENFLGEDNGKRA